MIFRTTFRETPRLRHIALIGWPCTKYARRIFAIVSTTSIPISAPMKNGSQCGPSVPGSRLEADHPENGVLIPCRNTLKRHWWEFHSNSASSETCHLRHRLFKPNGDDAFVRKSEWSVRRSFPSPLRADSGRVFKRPRKPRGTELFSSPWSLKQQAPRNDVRKHIIPERKSKA